MEGGEVGVALLECEGAEGEAEGDIVDGVGFGGRGDGGGGNEDFGTGRHCGGYVSSMEIGRICCGEG